MKKTITEADGRRVITTTNGVNTTTEALYVFAPKDYAPLPNGFVRELADDIIGYVERGQGRLWGQGSWRSILNDGYLGSETLEAIAELNPALVAGASYDRCGTTMCVAGWATELTAADWVVDVAAIRKGSTDWDDLVLVPRAEWADRLHDTTTLPLTAGRYVEDLKKRGFSSDTHVAVEAATYAERALGLKDGDTLNLFGASNTWWKVRGIIDAYTEFGVDPELLLMSADAELCVMVAGNVEAVHDWGHDQETVDRITEDLRARKVGHDYHRETAPRWALAKAGELETVG